MLSAKEKRELYMKSYQEKKDEIDKRITEGIEKHRKAFCQIKITDKDGKPITFSNVKLTQKNHEFNYGANIFMLDEFDTKEKNVEYRRFFKEYFNTATLPFYWDALESEEGKPRYAKNSKKIYRRPAPDLCMEYCEENGISPKLHCLVYEHFIPEWMKRLPLNEVKKKYEERFRQISERYSGRMLEFEVINETLCQWHDTVLGHEKDIIEWAFDLAHKYFPNETLIINEGANRLTDIGNTEVQGFTGYRTPYYLQLEMLLSKGVKFDKIGIQNHLFTGTSAHTEEEYEASVKDGVEMNNPLKYFKGLDMLAEFGLPIEITEVTVPTFGDTIEDEELQADMLKLWYSIWFSHPAVDTVVYWNTVDGYAYTGNPDWVENNCKGGLFHKDLTPKKSALMIKKLFNEVWHTETKLTTDNDGYTDFRGFYGDYELEIEINGKTVTKELSLSKNKNNSHIIKI